MTLNKNRFYAIKEASTGLFLDNGTVTPKFFPLGDRTKLFERMSDAMSRIEKSDLRDLMFWDDMEKHSGKDRWYIAVDNQFYEQEKNKYKFKVVPIEVKEIQQE